MDTTDAPQMIEHINSSLDFTPHDTKWVPASARFICCGVSTSGTGVLNVYELSRGKLTTPQKIFDIGPIGLRCATFGASNAQMRHVAVGDFGGSLSIVDMERAAAVDSASDSRIFSVKASNAIVNAIDGISGSTGKSHGAPELVTGGQDGLVRVWDPRVNHPVVSLEPEDGMSGRDCWTVAFGDSFNDEERCVAAGYDNGDLKLFDLRMGGNVRWETNCTNGVTSVEFDRADIEMNKLVVSTLESRFRIFDMRTQHPKHGFTHASVRAHRSTIWLARHLPQNRDIFITCGGNGGINLYRYQYPLARFKDHPDDGLPIGAMGTTELLNSRIISTQPITSFDWSPDKEGLSCLSSLDQTLRVYIVTKLAKL